MALLPGRTHDNAGQLPQIELEPYSLLISDLGYFSIVDMAERKEKKVYSLSRLRHDTVIFDEQREVFDLSSYTLQMKKDGVLRAELNVLIGKEEKLPVRLLRVPEMVSSQRRRKANKGASEKRKDSFQKESIYLYVISLF